MNLLIYLLLSKFVDSSSYSRVSFYSKPRRLVLISFVAKDFLLFVVSNTGPVRWPCSIIWSDLSHAIPCHLEALYFFAAKNSQVYSADQILDGF